MKNWFRRFFFFLGLASFTFLLMRFLELLRNGGELVFTASLLGGHILIAIGISVLAAFLIKPRKTEQKEE
ncbi:formate-dependent nitrite reductase membrane component NrfD [Dysgonomonas hofstadii]|uniref:Formate-dependent nitrite reductase membrane component NrfD n=1 Tax=Dysgonomonas hofstadii TaxID=637886 RepID=A0A840CQ44_9BACT|nr:hypothetical protein [Dysgonomonas hofstadii]MBB4037171.1 formate-dependent nitrite reductase membrane component NrfD [Dysgonomonas hofstadii]